MILSILSRTLVAFYLFLGLSVAAVAADSKLPTEHDPNSNYVIRYDDWDLILSASVLDTGPSDRRPASRSKSATGATKIKHSNLSPTAFEGNRVIFHVFTDDHEANLLAIRQDLEAVPDFQPLESFSKSEQLAYWFNLHNVAVMYEVAKEYPIKKLKKLASGKKSVWDKKTMTIAGVPTSIRDIEEHVVANWNDPLVLYGFYMGAIGGPNIRDHAYTGDNVVKALQSNAIEFVNSLRGFRLWSGAGRVSDHYKLGERYFPNFAEDIERHLTAFARPDTRRDLAKAKSFKIKNYDWGIADLKNGSVYSGSSFNTNPGALAFFLSSAQTSTGLPNTGMFDAPNMAVQDSIYQSEAIKGGNFGTVAPQTAALLRAMKERNERRSREGEVTVEEFTTGEGSRIRNRNEVESNDQEDSGSSPALAH